MLIDFYLHDCTREIRLRINQTVKHEEHFNNGSGKNTGSNGPRVDGSVTATRSQSIQIYSMDRDWRIMSVQIVPLTQTRTPE